jgi:hypothetical protein
MVIGSAYSAGETSEADERGGCGGLGRGNTRQSQNHGFVWEDSAHFKVPPERFDVAAQRLELSLQHRV